MIGNGDKQSIPLEYNWLRHAVLARVAEGKVSHVTAGAGMGGGGEGITCNSPCSVGWERKVVTCNGPCSDG